MQANLPHCINTRTLQGHGGIKLTDKQDFRDLGVHLWVRGQCHWKAQGLRMWFKAPKIGQVGL